MAPDANPDDTDSHADPEGREPAGSDEARLAAIAHDLADAVEAAVPRWIEGLVVLRVRQWSGHVSAEVAAEAVTAGEAAHDDVMPRMRALLSADVEDQRTNPLQLLREATGHASAVLAELGMPAMPRDQFSQRSFPEDVYGLMPARWDDIDPALQELGLTWGAAKAFVFKAHRRAGGFT